MTLELIKLVAQTHLTMILITDNGILAHWMDYEFVR